MQQKPAPNHLKQRKSHKSQICFHNYIHHEVVLDFGSLKIHVGKHEDKRLIKVIMVNSFFFSFFFFVISSNFSLSIYVDICMSLIFINSSLMLTAMLLQVLWDFQFLCPAECGGNTWYDCKSTAQNCWRHWAIQK